MINIFKNSGIRSIAYTNWLHPIHLKKIGSSIGSYYALTETNNPITIIVATDTRISSPDIKKYIIEGLQQAHVTIIDASIIPTPFVAHLLQKYPEASCGIMITASHNTPEYNGIKILTPTGYLSIEQELAISQLFHTITLPQIHTTQYPQQLIEQPIQNTIQSYIHSIKQLLQNNSFNNILLLADCAYGSTVFVAQAIFESFGIQTHTIHNTASGSFINVQSGAAHPQHLLSAMKKNNMVWGCAFDGDGDRVIIVHISGRIFDGDDLITILMQHPLCAHQKNIIGTIMTNKGTEQCITDASCHLIRASVGERNIIELLKSYKASLGFESCGHITVAQHVLCSDGIFATLLFFDTLTLYPHLINQTYIKYHQIQDSIPIPEHLFISEQSITKEIQYWIDKEGFLGRIIVRCSNTEPILRIMVEDQCMDTAQLLCDEIKLHFNKFFKNFTIQDHYDIKQLHQ